MRNKRFSNHEHELRRYLEGTVLLNFCPDHIVARIISTGERLSVALLSSILSALKI